MNWIIERIKEKSTWAGIIGVIATVGASKGWFTISPEFKEAILTAIGGITSAVLIGLNENKKPE